MRGVAKHVFVALLNIVNYIQSHMKFNGLWILFTRHTCKHSKILRTYGGFRKERQKGREPLLQDLQATYPSHVILCDINTTKNFITFTKSSDIVFTRARGVIRLQMKSTASR